MLSFTAQFRDCAGNGVSRSRNIKTWWYIRTRAPPRNFLLFSIVRLRRTHLCADDECLLREGMAKVRAHSNIGRHACDRRTC